MIFHNIPNQWRRKWEIIMNGKRTYKYCYTWHATEKAADDFLERYIQNLTKKPAEQYCLPAGEAKLKPNLKHAPLDTFPKQDVITLQPLV